MKKRTVILLWLIALPLGIAVYFIKFHHSSEKITHTQLTPGEKLLPNLPIRELTQVTLHQGDDTTTLTRNANNQWTIKERDNYPANHELLRNLLGTLKETRIIQGYPCPEKYLGRFGLASQSDEPSDLGLRVTMSTDQAPNTAQVFLGKYNGATRNSMGRFIRLSTDSSGVYAVGETFPGVYADPPTWLDKTFFTVQNIQSIQLSAPNDPTFHSRKLTRASMKPKDQFKLTDLKENEIMQLTSTGRLRTLFAVTSFQDVLSKDQVKKTSNPDPKLKRQVVITTFDNLTYTINYWPQIAKKLPSPDPDSPLPPAEPSYILTIKLQGEAPTSPRFKHPNETPEQTKALDKRHEEFLKNIPFVKSIQNRYFHKLKMKRRSETCIYIFLT